MNQTLYIRAHISGRNNPNNDVRSLSFFSEPDLSFSWLVHHELEFLDWDIILADDFFLTGSNCYYFMSSVLTCYADLFTKFYELQKYIHSISNMVNCKITNDGHSSLVMCFIYDSFGLTHFHWVKHSFTSKPTLVAEIASTMMCTVFLSFFYWVLFSIMLYLILPSLHDKTKTIFWDQYSKCEKAKRGVILIQSISCRSAEWDETNVFLIDRFMILNVTVHACVCLHVCVCVHILQMRGLGRADGSFLSIAYYKMPHFLFGQI